MSSYGPPGQPQYQYLQYGGPPPPPRRRGLSPLLIGGIVGGIVLLLVILVLVTNRFASDNPTDNPAGKPATVSIGGEPTGQAKQLTDALAALKMECSVRFTVNDAGHAGCFLWTDRGRTQSEVRFQYDADGTVTGINAQTHSGAEGNNVPTLKPLIAATAGVVFPADQDAVNQAIGTNSGAFDGAWGKYNTGTGAITRFVAQMASTDPLQPARVNATTTSAEMAAALKDKGFTCGADDEDCKTTYKGWDKAKTATGELNIRTTGLGAQGISYLLVSITDTSKDATEASNYKAFAGGIDTAYGLVQGPGTAEVQKWITDHADGESHTAYVGGWRVDLSVNYGSPHEPNLPAYIRSIMYTDALWTTPDQ